MNHKKGITRPLAAFTLSPEAIAKLRRLAAVRRLPRSRVVEQLIMSATEDGNGGIVQARHQ